MNWYENTIKLRIEWTSYCNAACPGCVRNIRGDKINPLLQMNHLDEDTWNQLLTDIADMDIVEVDFNGSVGDMIMHPRCTEFLQQLVTLKPKTFIRIATNGGARSTDFWHEMGTILRNQPHIAAFAIDGLEDTHHIHRRRTTYERVVENMMAFKSRGGSAKWVYTIFDHNVHQIEEADRRAESMQVDFHLRNSCIGEEDLVTDDYAIKLEHTAKYPTYNKHYNTNLWEDGEVRTDHRCFAGFADRSVAIDYQGRVHPCTHHMDASYWGHDPEYETVDGTVEIQPVFYLKDSSLKEILTNDWFNTTVLNAVAEARWDKCVRWCNVKS